MTRCFTMDSRTLFRTRRQAVVSCDDDIIDIQRCHAINSAPAVNSDASQFLQVIAVDCDSIAMTAPELVVDVLQTVVRTLLVQLHFLT